MLNELRSSRMLLTLEMMALALNEEVEEKESVIFSLSRSPRFSEQTAREAERSRLREYLRKGDLGECESRNQGQYLYRRNMHYSDERFP
jgi:hypothetical protein